MIKLYEDADFLRPGDFRLPSSSRQRRPHGTDTAGEYGRIIHSMAFRRLQGKMQLFPVSESPLLRNRLTHSLEVADIAARITNNLNKKYADTKEKAGRKIDVSIVTTAALAHDLGHPPFGHSGEEALNKFMDGMGSYEGNAQTLRIITRLENRFTNARTPNTSYKDVYRDPLGLNLCFRTIAACLKYDSEIPENSSEKHPKGYYHQEANIVNSIKRNVLRTEKYEGINFRTIECSIMDLADDIAYSTYDLEDCLIAGLMTPLEIMAMPYETAKLVSNEINKILKRPDSNFALSEDDLITPQDVAIIVFKLFDSIIRFNKSSRYELDASMVDRTSYVAYTHTESKLFSQNPLYRRHLTETLIRSAIDAVDIEEWNEEYPALTKVKIATEIKIFIETLKHFNFCSVIQTPRQQVYRARARKIVGELCQILEEDDKNRMLPDHIKEHLYNVGENGYEQFDYNLKKLVLLSANKLPLGGANRTYHDRRKRIICDYIASLTDAEAISLYGKLTSIDQNTIFGI